MKSFLPQQFIPRMMNFNHIQMLFLHFSSIFLSLRSIRHLFPKKFYCSITFKFWSWLTTWLTPGDGMFSISTWVASCSSWFCCWRFTITARISAIIDSWRDLPFWLLVSSCLVFFQSCMRIKTNFPTLQKEKCHDYCSNNWWNNDDQVIVATWTSWIINTLTLNKAFCCTRSATI